MSHPCFIHLQILKQSHGTAKKILKPKEDLKFSRKQNLHSVISKENIPPAVHTDILKSKLSELENEISRFKKENTVLETLRVEKEKVLRACVSLYVCVYTSLCLCVISKLTDTPPAL